MNRSEFIDKVFSFFKGGSDNQKTAYDIALSTREEIDWDRLYAITVREGETYLPKPKWFIERFYRCTKEAAQNYYENEGKIVEVALKSGHTYEFELYKCSKSKIVIYEPNIELLKFVLSIAKIKVLL